MRRVRVAGAGLSGLSAAWYLAREGAEVEIFETAHRPGGLIATHDTPDGIVETAANALRWTPDVQALFADLAIAPVFPRAASRRRYIVRNGRPRRWPLSSAETLATAMTFGARWAWRATEARDGETVAAWGRRVLGRAASAHLLGPALQGIYGAPADRLSAQAIGLGSRRPRAGMAAPGGGMGALIAALHRALERRGARFRFGTALDRLDPAVPTIIATAAPDAARLLSDSGLAPLADALNQVKTLPLVTATGFFEPRTTDLRGYGVLFPRGSARALGALFNTDTFDARGRLRSETWIYGDASLLDTDDAAITAAILADRRLISCDTQTPSRLVITRVPWALPLYDEAITRVSRACGTRPSWLGLCGNYAGSIGVASLVTGARVEAARLLRH